MTARVATVGDNCIDRYLAPVNLSTVGGNAVNVAVHLRRYEIPCAYFGAVGEDLDGGRTLEVLAQAGIDIDAVQVRPGVTAFTNLVMDASGERIMDFEEFGVCRGYRPSPADLDRLLGMRHVHIGWLDDGGSLKASLTRAGVSVSQDLAVNAGAANAGAAALSIAFTSAGPDRDKAERLRVEALAQGAGLVVVTMGPLGSLASTGLDIVAVAAASTSVVDTLGAGDTFIGAFLAGYLASRDLRGCLELGRDAAAETCTHWGGFPQPLVVLTDLP